MLVVLAILLSFPDEPSAVLGEDSVISGSLPAELGSVSERPRSPSATLAVEWEAPEDLSAELADALGKVGASSAQLMGVLTVASQMGSAEENGQMWWYILLPPRVVWWLEIIFARGVCK